MNILLVGACGTGKTWTFSEIIATREMKLGKIGKFRFHYDTHIVVVGIYDGSVFQGSDKLSMSVTTDLDKFLAWKKNRIALYEGDRFSNGKFIDKVNPIVIKILGDGAKGRKQRGTKQTERHLKSISTRVANIKEDKAVEDSKRALSVIKEMII